MASPETPSGANEPPWQGIAWQARELRALSERLRAALQAAEGRVLALDRRLQAGADTAVHEEGADRPPDPARPADAPAPGIALAEACAEARRCLRLALDEARAGRSYAAWDNLHQLDQAWLGSLDDQPAQRRLLATEIGPEALEKLGGWRLEAVKPLVQAWSDPAQVPAVAALRAVRSHLAVQSQNDWIKHEVRLKVTGNLVLLAVMALIFVFVTAGFGVYDALMAAPKAGEKPGTMIQPLFLGILAAFLGGVISVALSFESDRSASKLPALRLRFELLAWLRPVVGALCAVPVVFLVQSGFLTITGLSALHTTVMLCLVTGYSERWFFGVMERVGEKAGEQKEGVEKGSGK